MLTLVLWFAAILSASPAPPTAQEWPFYRFGVLEGGDTKNLNLERISLGRKGSTEVIDFSFTAGTRKLASPRVPPYQVRLEPFPTQPGRIIVLLQGLAARNVHRLALLSLPKKSQLINYARIYPPLEDGDTAVALGLKTRVEFKDRVKSGRLQVWLSPITDIPAPMEQLGKPLTTN